MAIALTIACIWFGCSVISNVLFLALCFHAGKFRGDDITTMLVVTVLGPIGLIMIIYFWLDDVKYKILWQRKKH